MAIVEPEGLQHGIALFNAGRFFEAHEALEDVWRASQGEEKRFLQALVQVAVALHHHSTGNLMGARSVLERATATLTQFPGVYCGLNVAELCRCLGEWLEALTQGRPAPAPPRVSR